MHKRYRFLALCLSAAIGLNSINIYASEVSGNLSDGIEALSKVLNLKGKVVPLTEDNVVLMADTKTKKYSLFALEHKQIGEVHIELGARLDHQTIDVQSEQKNYSGTAYSASAAANWEFSPNYKLSIVGSHQQRLPLLRLCLPILPFRHRLCYHRRP